MTTWRPWTLLALGGALLAAGPLLLVVVLALGGWWWPGPDAVVPRDGRPHVVRLEAGEVRALWSDRTVTDPVCRARDTAGRPVEITAVPPERRVRVGDVPDTAPRSVAQLRVPDDGELVLACDDVDADPPVDVGVGAVLSPARSSTNAVLSPLEAWAWLAAPAGGAVLVVVGALRLGRVGQRVP